MALWCHGALYNRIERDDTALHSRVVQKHEHGMI